MGVLTVVFVVRISDNSMVMIIGNDRTRITTASSILRSMVLTCENMIHLVNEFGVIDTSDVNVQCFPNGERLIVARITGESQKGN